MQDSTVTIEIVTDSGKIIKVKGRSDIKSLSWNTKIWDGLTQEAMFQIIKDGVE